MATEDERHEELLHAINENTKMMRSLRDDVRWFRDRMERVDAVQRNMLHNASAALRFGR